MTTEQDNIDAYEAAKAMGEDSHWERGRLALEWVVKHACGRSEGAYAEKVRESQQSVSAHLRVSREFTNRLVDLSWTHHLYALEETETPEEARAWLEQAARMKLSVRQMVACIKAAKKREKDAEKEPEGAHVLESLAEAKAAGQKFGTIYADPPWQYRDTRGNDPAWGGITYDTMSSEEIAALPVAGLAAEQAHLHLWTTNVFLEDALSILRAWGFEFKGCMIWVKTVKNNNTVMPYMGMGSYWRTAHEFMLLGVRGGLTFDVKDEPSWIAAPVGRHSAKPDVFRRTIERVSPAPRLELFGRKEEDGWTVFGNQCAKQEKTLLEASR